MTYIEGFVIAVPTANRAAFVKHARVVDELIMEQGALRIVECWGDDVPHGKQTDFYRAVQAGEAESVAFSWIEWPDKAAREVGMAKMQAIMKDDPRMDPEVNPIPFDGARMIFGGFEPVLILGE
jgi:uncharacterized protein YbaA (DUF1428 family)